VRAKRPECDRQKTENRCGAKSEGRMHAARCAKRARGDSPELGRLRELFTSALMRR
jgi:hypothetical protein